jgi:hypothetical protein
VFDVGLRNVTITLDEDILRAVRHRAVDRGLSLSKYVAEVLQRESCRPSEERAAARASFLRLLKEGVGGEWDGKVTWTRDELHER